MAIKNILLLGNKTLHKKSAHISPEELDKAEQIVTDLHDTIVDFKIRNGYGRAIAAPQIGERFRIIYMYIDGNSTVFINPLIEFPDKEMFEVWDDCMSFPGLEVKVLRYRRCIVHYRDIEWNEQRIECEGDLSELIQHEYDHLDGILAVQKVIDSKSFRYTTEAMNPFK